MTASELRVLVVDDEPPARDRMKRLLAAHADVSCVGEAGDGVSALELAREVRPDLVLLDVQMPELDGLAVARALGDDGPAVVFVTAHDEHAVRAFELAAVDYLLKPVTRERLAGALERVRGRVARGGAIAGAALRPSTRMAVRVGAKYVVFATSRIRAVLAQDHYAAILVDGQELLSDESLDGILGRLDPDAFVRVHRSAIVNLACVVALEQEGERKYVAVLDDPARTRIPVSREKLDDVKARLGV